MPSGSTTMVRYPAPFSSGTSLRNPNSEPNNPGMRTTGGPAPDVSTCRDSVAATGTLKLWRSAGSAGSATVRSQTIVPSGFEPRQEIYVEIPGSLQPSTWLRALWEMIFEAGAGGAAAGGGGGGGSRTPAPCS